MFPRKALCLQRVIKPLIFTLISWMLTIYTRSNPPVNQHLVSSAGSELLTFCTVLPERKAQVRHVGNKKDYFKVQISTFWGVPPALFTLDWNTLSINIFLFLISVFASWNFVWLNELKLRQVGKEGGNSNISYFVSFDFNYDCLL